MKRIEFEPEEKIYGTYWTAIEEAPSKTEKDIINAAAFAEKLKK